MQAAYNLCCQRAADVMTEIHTCKTEGVISLSQRKFTLVELHLHFQYIGRPLTAQIDISDDFPEVEQEWNVVVGKSPKE